MQAITRKPCFPPGTVVEGFPPVQRVLHADPLCEVSLLEHSGLIDLIMLNVQDADACVSVDRWLEHTGIEVIDRSAKVRHIRQPKGALRILRVEGRWMRAASTSILAEGEMYALMRALLERAQSARALGLSLRVAPSLIWMAGPGSCPRLMSLFADQAFQTTESDARTVERKVVTEIIRTFLWAATGIDAALDEESTQMSSLLQWCQNADNALSTMISQCLDPLSSIRTLEVLQQAVSQCEFGVRELGGAESRPTTRVVACEGKKIAIFRSS